MKFSKREDRSFLDPPDLHSCQADFPDAKTYEPLVCLSSVVCSFSSNCTIQIRNIKTNDVQANATLRKLVVFHRHGARISRRLTFGPYVWNTCSPREENVRARIFEESVIVIPSDDLADQFQPCKPMQLSSLGHQQLRQLGKALRSVYFDGNIRWSKGMLTMPLDKEEILVKSTKTMRTLESVQELLSGIYTGIDVGNIPVAITPSIAVEKSTKCPIEAIKQTAEWKKVHAQMMTKLKEMNQRMNVSTIFRDYTDTMIGRMYCFYFPCFCVLILCPAAIAALYPATALVIVSPFLISPRWNLLKLLKTN